MQFYLLDRSDRWNIENPSWNLVCKLICIGALTLMNTWLSSIDCRCSYSVSQVWAFMFELSRSKLHKTGDLQVGNWHVNCQHSSLFIITPCRWQTDIQLYKHDTAIQKKILNIKQHRNNGLKSQVNRHCEQFPCVIANPSLNRSRAKTICAWRSKNCSLLVDCSQDSRRGSWYHQTAGVKGA